MLSQIARTGDGIVIVVRQTRPAHDDQCRPRERRQHDGMKRRADGAGDHSGGGEDIDLVGDRLIFRANDRPVAGGEQCLQLVFLFKSAEVARDAAARQPDAVADPGFGATMDRQRRRLLPVQYLGRR